ncbi:MAG: hypothetical protein IC227_07005 [Enterococcus lacertideformus]|uniref:Lipoprotein n=1 Tax=Enterococcus lacertideformus TaxID=2771493 RepID=A0A931AZ94_9ENTE|nr:hypothetical protein [Enterococcus lacertideformus]
MKVIFSCLIATGLLFVLVGCGSKDDGVESIDSINAQSTVKASDSMIKGQSIFQGEIENITEAVESTVHIKVVNIQEIEDPENIGTSFENDGVTLNATIEQLYGGKEVFHKGDQVQFILTDKPVMTMSIPPQIPGNSIIEVSVVK